MGLGLTSLLYSTLLFINSLAILSHQRFLLPLGLSNSIPPSTGGGGGGGGATGYDNYNLQQGQADGIGGGQQQESIKYKLISLVSAVRTLMRIPLIPINIIVILYEIILG